MSALRSTLALDASTYVGTIAVWDAAGRRHEGEAAMRGAHEERLMPAVAALLEGASLRVHAVERIVCGGGPGSFTSLRIAAAIAKGIASVRGEACAFCSAPSLALLVASEGRAAGRYLAALDAMRGEWYAQLFEVDAQGVVHAIEERTRMEGGALAAGAASARATLLRGGASDGGSGLALPHARGVERLDAELIAVVDLSSWEPDYGRLAEAQVKWEVANGRPLVARAGDEG